MPLVLFGGQLMLFLVLRHYRTECGDSSGVGQAHCLPLYLAQTL